MSIYLITFKTNNKTIFYVFSLFIHSFWIYRFKSFISVTNFNESFLLHIFK